MNLIRTLVLKTGNVKRLIETSDLCVACYLVATLVLLSMASNVQAVVVTSGTGPGGVGRTNGATLDSGVAELSLWFRADLGITKDGSNLVSAWADQSGYGRTASQGTGGLQPLWQGSTSINGMDVVNFDGTDDRLSGSSVPIANAASAATLIAMIRPDTAASAESRRIFSLGNTTGTVGDAQMFIRQLSTNFSQAFDRSAPVVANTAAATGTVNIGTANSRHIVTGNFNRVAGTADVYTDGGDFATATATGGFSSATFQQFDVGAFVLASPATPAQFFDGPIPEIAVFSTVLNHAERTVVDNYLQARYDSSAGPVNLTISDDYYLGDTTTNGNYDFDVFGVGRVDASNQLLNSGSRGFGIEATANLGDGDFALAGQKSATNTLVSAVTESYAGDRMSRVWYVDYTGSFDGNLAFDVTGLGITPGSTLNLLYSGSQTFSWTPKAGVLHSGNYVEFSGLTGLGGGNLPDGYYTLGVAAVPEPGTFAMLLFGGVTLWMVRRNRA